MFCCWFVCMTNLNSDCLRLCADVSLLVIWIFSKLFHTHPPKHPSDLIFFAACGECHDYTTSFFFFPTRLHLADSQPSYPPFKCVNQEPHEASFAPFTPSSGGDQCSLSADASTPISMCTAPCYSQCTGQAQLHQ